MGWMWYVSTCRVRKETQGLDWHWFTVQLSILNVLLYAAFGVEVHRFGAHRMKQLSFLRAFFFGREYFETV